MPYTNASPGTAANHQPLDDSADILDAHLIDDEFDEFLDRQIFAIRELADFSSL